MRCAKDCRARISFPWRFIRDSIVDSDLAVKKRFQESEAGHRGDRLDEQGGKRPAPQAFFAVRVDEAVLTEALQDVPELFRGEDLFQLPGLVP